MKKNVIVVGLIGVSALLFSCKEDDITPTEDIEVTKLEVKTTYSKIAYASYKDSYTEAKALQVAVQNFVLTPSNETLAKAKLAWIAAREPYGQTETFRFSEGPIDSEEGVEGLLNAWPLNESYIDYVEGDANSGIINDQVGFPTITKEILAAANESGGESNIAVGYHAIEFLLWGQDNPDEALLAPGSRTYTDYTTASNYQRRGEVLLACAELLVENLEGLVDEWDPNQSGNFRDEFMSMKNNDAMKLIFTGMGILSKAELAGERIYVALDNQDQEDEHSCFSDNTHRDIYLNALGIYNLYKGSYKTIDDEVISGTSVHDLITMVNPSLSASLLGIAKDAIEKAAAIPVPFDFHLKQETVTGNGPIMQSVVALQLQGDKLAEAASALGISVSVALPE